jgi:CTP:molybdopterin cytidylyltransferase MocA
VDAIVTAGGIPTAEEPLYAITQGAPKALAPIAGKPMVQWVLDALSDSENVRRVVVVGLEASSGVTCAKPLAFIPNQGGMLDNIFAAANKILSDNPAAKVILSVSSDIPAISGTIVDWMAGEAAAGEYDIYYNFVPRPAMDSRFPGSKRTFTRFKDVEVCGGDLTGIHTRMLTQDNAVWRDLINARKNVLKQAAIIGYGTLLLMLLRQLTIEDAVRRVSHRLGLKARALNCPYPEIGMDVDKPHQLELLERDLLARGRG